MLDYKILIFGFIPEWFFASFLGLAIFGIRLKWPKYIKLTLIIAVLSYLSKSVLINFNLSGFHVFAYLAIIVLAYRYFLSLGWKISLASALAIFILLFTSKFLMIIDILGSYKVIYSDLARDPWLEVAISNTIDLPIYLIGIFTYVTGFKIADFSGTMKKSKSYLKNVVESKALLAVNILLINLLLTELLIMYHYLRDKKIAYVRIMSMPNVLIILVLFGLVILAGTIFLIFNITSQLKKISKMEKEEAVTAANSQKAQFLHSERKEFSRQLGLIDSFIKEKKTEELSRYLAQVSYEVSTVGNLSILQKPELKALLLQKAGETQKRNISVQYSINSTLNNLEVTSAELISLIGNLLDNAIEALENTDCSPKEILLNVCEDDNKIIFEIYNNEPIIPLEIQEKIFTRGVSTKEKEGRGYGLAIVKKIVNNYKGHISLQSLPGAGTLFVVDFPKILPKQDSEMYLSKRA